MNRSWLSGGWAYGMPRKMSWLYETEYKPVKVPLRTLADGKATEPDDLLVKLLKV